jgi:hypothetical protein
MLASGTQDRGVTQNVTQYTELKTFDSDSWKIGKAAGSEKRN